MVAKNRSWRPVEGLGCRLLRGIGLLRASVGLLGAALLLSTVACGGGGGGGGGGEEPAPAASTSAPAPTPPASSPAPAPGDSGSSGSGSSAGSGSGSGSGSSGGGAVPATRTYSVRWRPPAGAQLLGFQLSAGDAPGSYRTPVDIPLSAARLDAQPGVLTYDIELPSGRDQYLMLRAYNAAGLSSPSNVIRVPALVGVAAPLPGSGGSGDSGGTGGTSGPGDVVAGSGMVSIDLDGVDEYLGTSAPVSLGPLSLFTVSVWLRPTLDDSPRRVLFEFQGASDPDAGRISVAVLEGGDLELVLHDTAGLEIHRATYAGVVLDDEWQSLAVAFDGETDAEPRVFLDGLLQEPSTMVSAPGVWLLDSVEQGFLYLGAGDVQADTWLGLVGHAAVWAHALADAELVEIAARGHELDLRVDSDAYASSIALAHYWRPGDVPDHVGYDFGPALEPADLDEPAGNVDASDISGEAPASM